MGWLRERIKEAELRINYGGCVDVGKRGDPTMSDG
jgi:hypothetical protein